MLALCKLKNQNSVPRYCPKWSLNSKPGVSPEHFWMWPRQRVSFFPFRPDFLSCWSPKVGHPKKDMTVHDDSGWGGLWKETVGVFLQPNFILLDRKYFLEGSMVACRIGIKTYCLYLLILMTKINFSSNLNYIHTSWLTVPKSLEIFKCYEKWRYHLLCWWN